MFPPGQVHKILFHTKENKAIDLLQNEGMVVGIVCMDEIDRTYVYYQ